MERLLERFWDEQKAAAESLRQTADTVNSGIAPDSAAAARLSEALNGFRETYQEIRSMSGMEEDGLPVETYAAAWNEARQRTYRDTLERFLRVKCIADNESCRNALDGEQRKAEALLARQPDARAAAVYAEFLRQVEGADYEGISRLEREGLPHALTLGLSFRCFALDESALPLADQAEKESRAPEQALPEQALPKQEPPEQEPPEPEPPEHEFPDPDPDHGALEAPEEPAAEEAAAPAAEKPADGVPEAAGASSGAPGGEGRETAPERPGDQAAPAELAQYLLGLKEPLRETELQIRLLEALCAENSWVEAVTLAKTLAEAGDAGASEKETMPRLYQELLHATNFPLDERRYGSDSSMKLTGELELDRYCGVATMFWSLCFPEMPYDYDLWKTYKSRGEKDIDDLIPRFPKVKSAFALLIDPIRDTVEKYYGGQGFSAQVLRTMSTDSSVNAGLNALRVRAGNLKALKRNDMPVKGIEEFMRITMGPTSRIGKCILDIEQNKPDIYDAVREVYEPFTENGGAFTLGAIDEYIDSVWDRVDKNVPRLKNASPAREKIIKALWERLKLLSDWLKLNAAADTDIDSDILGKFKNDIAAFMDYLSSAREEMEGYLGSRKAAVGEQAGLRLLIYVFGRICAILKNADADESRLEEGFLEFARTPCVALDASGRPVIDRSFNDIPGMEPWRMVLSHIRETKLEYDEVLRAVDDPDSPWYEEYTTGIALLGHLGRDTDAYGIWLKPAADAAAAKEKAFAGKLRLDCANGRVSEAGKETIATLLNRQKSFFCSRPGDEEKNNHNYAHFRMLLRQLEEMQKAEWRERVRELRSSIDERIANLASYEETPEALRQAETMIEQGVLLMAEDYITRYDSDPNSVEALNLSQLEEEVRWLDTFLEEADAIYENACNKEQNKRMPPSRWAMDYLASEKAHRWSTPNERASARKLVDSWILGNNNSNTPSHLKGFLQALGFQPAEGAFNRRSKGQKNGQEYEIYRGRLKPSSTRMTSYPHPVARFGTNFGGVEDIDVNLVCIYGSKSASTLLSTLEALDIGSAPSVVFMDGSLTTNERRHLASKFKIKTGMLNPILIVDRVMLVFLASLNSGDRLRAFFQCTLPYTFEQLHTEGSGTIPDEMFFGRGEDLRSITDPNGACLVYGGRQLGKTALLKRAESVNNEPDSCRYAFYIDIKKQGPDKLVSKLNDELRKTRGRDGAPLLESGCANLEEICAALERRRDAYKQITILVDEADVFFRDIAKQDYEPIHPIVELRKKTSNRVKFVFAGTHNVAKLRSANAGNNDPLQLGTPLCIKPLSMTDAANLITYPLSYLGFRIGEEQVAMILNNTNRYPGVIHIFCHNLVEVLCKKYSDLYANKEQTPPYHISESQMAELFKDRDLKGEIKKRVLATIDIDEDDHKYAYVANLLAYLEYDSADTGRARLYGFTPKELLRFNEEMCEIPEFMPDRMSIEELDLLMTEMVDMGILWKKPDSSCYRFQQRDFLGYLGTKETIGEALLSHMGELS